MTDSTITSDYRDLLEPAAAAEAPARSEGPSAATQAGALLSIAVSLKRVADTLEMVTVLGANGPAIRTR